MGKCHFQEMWLEKKDCEGTLVKVWARKFDKDNAFCIVCSKKIPTCKGFQAINQHAKGIIHKKQLHLKFSANQLHLQTGIIIPNGEHRNVNNSNQNQLKLYSSKESAIKAEIIWTLRAVIHNYSINSCDGIKDTFSAMFPEGFNEQFTMSPTKMSYIITDALGPYFKKILLDDAQGSYFSLCYDETTNKGGHKELQLKILYWSNIDQQVNSRHLCTTFIGHATSNDLIKKINIALDHANLSRNKMLMLGSDGPNVNKSIYRLMNQSILEIRGKGLINIGTCNLHLVHNAFMKGLEAFGDNCADLLVSIKYFFKDKPARWEDYQKSQQKMNVPTHRFIKHVSSRWLSLRPAAERLTEQWPAVVDYFKHFIPTKNANIMRTLTYKTIVNILKISSIKSEILFVISSAKLFEKFSLIFQKDEPQIYVLHAELIKLIKTLIMRFCKASSIKLLESGNTNPQQIFSNDNYLPIEKMIVGQEVETEISNIKNDRDKLEIYHNIRTHYTNACTYLLKKSSLETSNLLRYLRCLHPNRIKKPNSAKEVIKVLKVMPIDIKTEVIADDWNLLQLEALPNFDDNLRVDVYWNNIFQLKTDTGEKKFQNLAVLIKAALSISHGNADVERGFSQSGKIVTKDRALLGERMLNNLLHIKDGMTRYNNKSECVPITKELLIKTEFARRSYMNYLETKRQEDAEKVRLSEEAKRIKEQQEETQKKVEEMRKTVAESEKILQDKLKEAHYQKQTSQRLLEEANDKLKRSLKNQDLVGANMAQVMIETVKKRIAEERTIDVENEKVQNKIGKRKTELITNYLSKKSKQ